MERIGDKQAGAVVALGRAPVVADAVQRGAVPVSTGEVPANTVSGDLIEQLRVWRR